MNNQRRRSRVSKNRFTTRTGSTIKIHRSLTDRFAARKNNKDMRKAARLSGLPTSRVKRFFYRLHPKRMAAYWFSRDGGIMALKIMGIGFISGFLVLVGLFAYFRKDLPNLRNASGDNLGGSIRYFDKTGQTLLWEDYDAVKRIPVQGDQISQDMKDATVAIEDKDFFKHGGFDVRGITRAAFNNITGSSSTQQGGSTITQQLVKLSNDWTKDQTYTRKVKELILSVELERSYSKQEILAGYLNTAPYGNVQYGVEAATRDYFEKSAKDITLDEAAFLAAVPKSPSFYSPYGAYFDRDSLVGRQHYILDQMVHQGMISSTERDEAKKIDTLAKLKPKKPNKYEGIISPWFVTTAKRELEDRFGSETVKRGGWKVTTTLDMNLQKIAEEQVAKGIVQVRRQRGDVASFVAEDVKTGHVVALVGGVDFNNKEFGEFNYARTPLPPGSSFKPYDYAALIEHTDNFGAGSVLYDVQERIEGYPCTNKKHPKSDKTANCLWDYDFRFPGPMTLRYALGGSRNVPAVKAMLIAGVDKTIQTAEKLGLKSGYKCYHPSVGDITLAGKDDEIPCGGSSAIGDGAYLKMDEHVHGYASLSRNGVNIPQTYIMKIEDAQGKTNYEWKASKGEQAVRPDTAYIVSDMLSDPNASYFPTGRKPHRYNGWKFAMKTGTTNDAKDGWMAGYSSQYAAAVWVGYHTRQKEMSGTMEAMTQPIWQGWMQAAHKGLQPQDWQKPAGIKSEAAFVVRSHVGLGSVEPSPAQDLFPSWYKNTKKVSNEKRVIDQVSNKLATDCTPQRARKEVTDAAADAFSGDTFHGATAGGTNNTETDDVHKCEDIKPSITLTTTDNGDGSYTLTAAFAQGTHPLSSDKFKGNVTFSVDGQTLPGGSYEVSASGAVSYQNYKPEGDKTVTATIVDSVLYDATDSRSVSGSSASAMTLSVQNTTGNSYKFTWTSATGATSYELCISSNSGGSYGCGAAASPHTTAVSGGPGNKRAYVKSNNGVQSAIISF